MIGLLCRLPLQVEKQFTFYASYHDHPVNQWIHFMCIWPIMWTSLVFFAGTRPVLPLPESAAMLADLGVEFDWAFIISVIYATYYILLEKRLAGVVGAAMVMACCVTASYFAKEGVRRMDGQKNLGRRRCKNVKRKWEDRKIKEDL